MRPLQGQRLLGLELPGAIAPGLDMDVPVGDADPPANSRMSSLLCKWGFLYLYQLKIKPGYYSRSFAFISGSKVGTYFFRIII